MNKIAFALLLIAANSASAGSAENLTPADGPIPSTHEKLDTVYLEKYRRSICRNFSNDFRQADTSSASKEDLADFEKLRSICAINAPH